MTSVLFPTYFLARLVVRRGWALFAAIGAAAIPSLAYSSWIVEETVAYPYAALCLFLIAKALIERSRGWIAGAIIASLFAPFVRGELVMIPIAFVFAAFFAVWSSDWGIRRRSTWSVGDYIGVFVLAAGLIITISGVASHHSQQWYSVTTYYKHRIFVLGDWAAGALMIGIGVIPLVFGLAALVPVERRAARPTRVRLVPLRVGSRDHRLRALHRDEGRLPLDGLRDARRGAEPHLHRPAPLHRHRARPRAQTGESRRARGAGAYGFYLVVGTPYKMGVQLYSDALGFSILQQANRYYEWTPAMAQWLLIGILLGGVALLAGGDAGAAFRHRLHGVAAALAIGILAWNVTGEISAASRETCRSAASSKRRCTTPSRGSTRSRTGSRRTTSRRRVADKNPEWELEFWNRSIVRVESLDSTLDGPGPSGTPNVTADGRVYWSTNPNARAACTSTRSRIGPASTSRAPWQPGTSTTAVRRS